MNGGFECFLLKVRNEIVIIWIIIEIFGINLSFFIEVDNSISYWYGLYKNSLKLRKYCMIINYRGELKRILILYYVYWNIGFYNIIVSVGNDVFILFVNCVVEIFLRFCKKFEIILNGVGDFFVVVIFFFVVDVVEIEVNIEIFCFEFKELIYEWNIF